MKINKLEEIILEMRKNNIRVTNFKYYDGPAVFSVLIFDIHPIVILFIERKTKLNFEIIVSDDFTINTYLNKDDLKTLRKMLGITNITSTTEKFSTNKFFDNFMNSIPNYVNLIPKTLYEYRKSISKYIEDCDKTGYIGEINHNANNSNDKKRSSNVSKENLNKTLVYFGEDMYKLFKFGNISSRWTTIEEVYNNPKYIKYRDYEVNKKQLKEL